MFLSAARLPYDSSKLPMNMALVAPPLPQSGHWRENGLVGTDRWVSITPHMRGAAGFFRAKGGLEDAKFADGAGFPDVEPWSLGMWLKDFRATFLDGEEIGKKAK